VAQTLVGDSVVVSELLPRNSYLADFGRSCCDVTLFAEESSISLPSPSSYSSEAQVTYPTRTRLK
jgi:hypothetical protein